MKIFYDKKAGEKLLSLWWFLVLIIIGGGIFIGVSLFYSAEINVKQVEAEMLYDKIFDCFSSQDDLTKIFSDENSGFDIFSECGLNKNVFDNAGIFYLKINFFDETGNQIGKSIEVGDKSLEKDCDVSKVIFAKHYSGCYKNKEFVDGKSNLEILSVSNQNGRNVKVGV